jgi:2-keto-4-pentenoate hydratase
MLAPPDDPEKDGYLVIAAQVDDAWKRQDQMAEQIGGSVAGWKVGAAVRAVQLFEGHDAPLPGRIFADRCFDSAAKIPADLFASVKIECEFAFRLMRKLPNRLTPLRPDEIAEALTFHPALELAANRYAPGTNNRLATTFDGIADNGSGGAAVGRNAMREDIAGDELRRMPLMALPRRLRRSTESRFKNP